MAMKVSRLGLVKATLVLLVAALVGGGAFRWTIRYKEPDVDPRQFDGAQAMAERLKEFAAQNTTDVIMRIAQSTSPLVKYYSTIKEPPDDRSRALVEAKNADKMMVEGNTVEAIQHYLAARSLAEQKPELFDKAFFHAFHDVLGIAYMRLGEQQNCLDQRTAESCLLPIRGSGVHRLTEGSRSAVREYEQFLEEEPGDLTARWLLNIAYMTLGEYPERVPARWLIPPEVFKSDYDIGRFPDVAGAAGVAVNAHAGGAIMEDFDRDGYLDIMASSNGLRDQIHYFHNNGDGTFTDRTQEAGLMGITGGLNMIHADYDNDGYPDVLILRGGWLGEYGRHPRSLLHNKGDGTFEDVTVKAGLLTFNPTQVAAWGDFDNDGWLDLFIGNETPTFAGAWNVFRSGFEPPEENPSFKRHPTQLYHNNHDGTFTNVAAETGLETYGFIKGAAWGDYDNDGLLDLIVSVFLEPSRLYHNNGMDASGRWRFEDVTDRAKLKSSVFNRTCWFFDYNNDGWLDLFIAEVGPYAMAYPRTSAGFVAADYLGMPRDYRVRSLFRNNGDGTFTDVTAEVGLDHINYTMGANFGDLDNDGYQDIYLSTGNPDYRTLVPKHMYRNDEGRRFQDVTTSGGFGHLGKGHGVAFGDIDNDGDQDIYAVFGGAFAGDVSQNALFLNPGHPGNHWVTLELEGVRSNRAAIGARIKVTVETSAGSTRDIYAVVSTGGSFGSSSLRRQIGLGQAKAIRAIEVKWPASGTVQEFKNVPMDVFLKIREGAAAPERLERKAFKISTEPGPEGAAMSHMLHTH